MNLNQTAFFCLLLAFVLSNLPFVVRWTPAFRLSSTGQSRCTSARIALWLILYAGWVFSVMRLGNDIGIVAAKDWSLWPVSAALFAVMAFPGVVYGYLWRPGDGAGKTPRRLAARLCAFSRLRRRRRP